MFKRILSNTSFVFIAGLSAGLLVGVGMLVGALVTKQQTANQITLPDHVLNATATHGSESFAIATGAISDGVEGIFFLDFLTGELTCNVVDPRGAGMAGMYRRNVTQDLGVAEGGKNPTYLMVTGKAEFRVSGGNVRPAESLVYVVDANSGKYVAYWLPWNKQAVNVRQPQFYDLKILGSGSARNIELQE